MPAPGKKTPPMEVMTEGLVYCKRRCLRKGIALNEASFNAAWDEVWAWMRSERAWAHATERRKEQRDQMLAQKPEFLKAWVGARNAADAIFALREGVEADALREDAADQRIVV